MIRVVATADNHLSRHYDRLSPQKLQQRRKYLRDGFRAAVDHALHWNAQLFCICGDLFDTPDPRNVERVFVARCFAELHRHGVAICAVAGNHDTPRQSTDQGGMPPLEVYRELGGIHFFDQTSQIVGTTLDIAGTRIAIGGLGVNPAAPPGADPLAHLEWQPRAQGAATAILLLHGQVEGHTVPGEDGPIFARASLRDRTDADLILIGDIHRSQAFPLAPGRQVIIPGATERMTFGEAADVPGFLALQYLPDQGWSAQRHPVVAQPRVELAIHTTELPETPIDQYLIDRVTEAADPMTQVKLTLTGIISRDRYHQLNLRAVQDQLVARVFACTIDTSGLVLEGVGQSLTQRGVRLSQQDELRTYAQELIDATPTPDDQAITRAALQSLLEQYG